MSDILEISVIPAELVTVDFEKNTWTLEVPENTRASAGYYVIISRQNFNLLAERSVQK